MKKSIFFSAILLFVGVSTTLKAQFGIRGGVNLSSLSASATETTYSDYERNSILGYQLGLIVPLKVSDRVAIQPELLWVQKGGKSTYGFSNSNKLVVSQTYNYVEVPVSLKLSFGQTLGNGIGAYVLVGPYLGLATGGKTKRELTIAGATTTTENSVNYDNSDKADRQKRLDYGGQVGAGVSIGKLFLDVRYSLGFNNLLDSDTNNSNDNSPYLRTRGLGLTAGFMF